MEVYTYVLYSVHCTWLWMLSPSLQSKSMGTVKEVLSLKHHSDNSSFNLHWSVYVNYPAPNILLGGHGSRTTKPGNQHSPTWTQRQVLAKRIPFYFHFYSHSCPLCGSCEELPLLSPSGELISFGHLNVKNSLVISRGIIR